MKLILHRFDPNKFLGYILESCTPAVSQTGIAMGACGSSLPPGPGVSEEDVEVNVDANPTAGSGKAHGGNGRRSVSVVVVGAGFFGLEFLQHMSGLLDGKVPDVDVSVTVVDKKKNMVIGAYYQCVSLPFACLHTCLTVTARVG